MNEQGTRRVAAAAALLATTVLGLTVLAGAPAAQAAPATDYSQASTVSAVAVQSVNAQYPLLFTGIDRPVSAYSAYVTGELDSTGVSDAQAAIFTPGPGLEQGVGEFQGLICDGAPQIPRCTTPLDNPLEAYATYPAVPSKTAQASGPAYAAGGVGLAGGTAVATAGTAANTAKAAAGGGSVLGGSAQALDLGAVSSSLTQTMTATGLLVTATSTVSHVSLAGVLTVDSITATAHQTLAAGKVTARDADVTLAGVRALGQPASVDGTGVHVLSVGDSGRTLAALNAAVASALKAASITVTAGEVDRSATGSGGRTSASGLTVSYDRTAPALPASVAATLGKVGVPGLPSRFTGTVVLGSAGAVTGSVAVPDQVLTLPSAALPPVSTPGGAVAAVPGSTTVIPGTAGTAAASGALPPASPKIATTGYGSVLEHWSLRAPYLVLVALALLVLLGVVRGARHRAHPDEDM